MKQNDFAVKRLTELNSKLDKVLEFRARDEEESKLGKAAKIGAGVVGAGAIGYGAASYMRGRNWQKKVLGLTPSTMSDQLAALRTGNSLNMRDAKAGYGAAKQSAADGFAKAKAAAGNLPATAKDVAGKAVDATKSGAQAAMTAGRGAYDKVASRLFRGRR